MGYMHRKDRTCRLSLCNTSFSKLCHLVNYNIETQTISSYTEENLDKLLHKDLIAIVLAMQSKMSANSAEISEEIRKLKSKFDIL